MRLMMSAVAGLALAGPVVGQSAAPRAEWSGGGSGASMMMMYQPAQIGGVSTGASAGAGGGSMMSWSGTLQPSEGRPGAEAPITAIRSFVQQQQRGPLQIDGKPVTLRATGASLQVYLGDEPYPESRMKSEEKRTLLMDSEGKPAGQMLIEGQRVILAPVGGEAQQPEGRLLIGVSLSPVDSTLAKHLKIEPAKASVISGVTDGWPASKAGLESGDIILSVEGKDEGTSEAIRAVIAEHEAGDAIKLRVISGGAQKEVTVTLSDEARAAAGMGLGSATLPSEYWSAVQRAPQGLPAVTDLSRLAPSGLLYQLQQAEEPRTGQLRRQAGQGGAGSAGSGGQRSAEVADAQIRALREQVAAARQSGEQAAVAEAQARALREQFAAQRARELAVATPDGARVTVDIPSGGIGGRAVIATRPEGDISRRLAALEERMARIEKLLQQLTEQSGSR